MYTSDFFQYLQVEKRSSIHTLRAYVSDLTQFSEFISDQFQINSPIEALSIHVRSWVSWLIEHKNSTRSVNRKLTCLRTYYKFCIRNGYTDNNPMNKVITPRCSKRLPWFIEEKNINNLFSEIDFGDGFIGCRDKAILETFYGTGMRLSELMNLKEDNINFHNNTMKVLGKRNKERIIPFGNTMKNTINDYQEIKQEAFENIEHSKYLFINTKGMQLNSKNIYLIVRKYLSKITTISQRSPHVLRHTYATHLLNNGAELNSIKEILGHANLSATQIYTHTTINKLKSTYKQAHPRA